MKDESQASQAIVALNGSTNEKKKLLVKRARFWKGGDGSMYGDGCKSMNATKGRTVKEFLAY